MGSSPHALGTAASNLSPTRPQPADERRYRRKRCRRDALANYRL
jgi:hypothetical protein